MTLKRKILIRPRKTHGISDYQCVTGLFWDYENVPLRSKDYERFVIALKNYYEWHSWILARVYVRKDSPITSIDRQWLRQIPLLDIKTTKQTGPNAADFSLMRSCVDILKTHGEINHVFLITGDGDFHPLLEEMHQRNLRVTIIYQRGNYNTQLVSATDRFYSVEQLVNAPRFWWMY